MESDSESFPENQKLKIKKFAESFYGNNVNRE